MNTKDNFIVQAHPWHGISPGEKAPETVTAFIEIVPLDTVKYEIDKVSGHLKLDRPHKYSSLCPTLYGFIPQTYCGNKVAELVKLKTGKNILVGDNDPMDICVLTERAITRSSILVSARPIGGLRLIDRDESDDKIISVLIEDPVFGDYTDLSQIPKGLLDRLRHYFLTYKEIPEVPISTKSRIEISDVYGADEALSVINESIKDYQLIFKR